MLTERERGRAWPWDLFGARWLAFRQEKKKLTVSRSKLGMAAWGILSGNFRLVDNTNEPSTRGEDLTGLWRGLQVVQEDFWRARKRHWSWVGAGPGGQVVRVSGLLAGGNLEAQPAQAGVSSVQSAERRVRGAHWTFWYVCTSTMRAGSPGPRDTQKETTCTDSSLPFSLVCCSIELSVHAG